LSREFFLNKFREIFLKINELSRLAPQPKLSQLDPHGLLRGDIGREADRSFATGIGFPDKFIRPAFKAISIGYPLYSGQEGIKASRFGNSEALGFMGLEINDDLSLEDPVTANEQS